jgi:hypothetical protein
MALSDATVLGYLKRLGNYRVEMAQMVALEGDPDEISGALLLALGLRESGLQNITNPAGTDRGCFQISETWHPAFLKAQPGCPDGTWKVERGHTAIEKGYVPRYTPALVYAMDMLQDRREVAELQGVPRSMRLRFAIAAYNAGLGGVLQGWTENRNVDQETTGGDYSAWVITHRTIVNRVLNRSLPNWVVKA